MTRPPAGQHRNGTQPRIAWALSILVGAGLVSGWVGIEAYVASERQRAVDTAEVDLRNVSLLFADHARRTISTVDQILIDMRQTLRDDPGRFDIRHFTARLVGIEDLVVHVAAADRDGWILQSSTGDQARGLYIGDRPNFRRLRDSDGDRLTITAPVIGRASRQLSLQFQRRILDVRGHFDGLVQISISPVALSQFYSTIQLGAGANLSLSSRDGVVYATAPHAEHALSGEREPADEREAVLNAPDGLVVIPNHLIGGNAYLSVMRAVHGYPIVTRVSLPLATISAGAHGTVIRYRLAGSALSIVALLGLWGALRLERRMREALAELAQKSVALDATLENVSQGIMMVDPSGRVLVANDRLSELTGISPAMLAPGKTLNEIRAHLVRQGEIPADDMHVDPIARRFVTTGLWQTTDGSPAEVYERRRPNGTLIEVRTVLLPQGGFVRTITDVTAQRSLQTALEDNERFLEQVSEVAGVGGWEMRFDDADGPRWTEQTRRIHDVGPDYQPTYEEAFGFFPPDARALLQQACDRAVSQGDPFDLELPLLTALGRQRYVRVTGRCDQVEGMPLRIVGAFSDITERRAELDEKLMLSELARQTTNGVVITDTTGRIRWVNPSFERISGFTLDAMRGQRPGDILQGPDTAPETIAVMREALHERRPFDVELVNYNAQGMPYWVSISCSPMFDVHGVCTGFMAIETDATERKAHEAAIANYARDLERFAHVASHDLQEPLRKIATHARLLQTALREDDTAEVDRCVDVLINSAQRGRNIVDDLLRYAKLKDKPLARENVQLDALVAEVCAQFEGSGDFPLTTITRHVAPTVIRGDTGLLRQVFQNVVGNAVKYRKKGEAVHVHVGLEPHPRGDGLILSVVDDGIGFDPAQSDKIFQPFTRLVTRSDYAGTGIGLSLVRSILEKHGWTIWADSVPGTGTTFHIAIPRRDVVVEETSRAA